MACPRDRVPQRDPPPGRRSRGAATFLPSGNRANSPAPNAFDRRRGMALRKFIIERDIPAVGSFEREQLQGAAAKSNGVLRDLGPDIQWVESYVAADKTFCVYLAKDEAIVHEHARRSGFPANKVTEGRRMIDPTTATEA